MKHVLPATILQKAGGLDCRAYSPTRLSRPRGGFSRDSTSLPPWECRRRQSSDRRGCLAEPDCSEAVIFWKASESKPKPNRPSTRFILGTAALAAQPTTPPLQCKKSWKSSLDTVLRLRRRQMYFSAWPQRLFVLLCALHVASMMSFSMC